MITGRDFVFTGMQPWDIPFGSNAKDIALEVSKQNRVLYINTPLDLKTLWKGDNTPDFQQRKNVVNGKAEVLRQITPTLWVLDYPFTVLPVNFLPDGFLFDFVNRLNNRKMYSFILKKLKELKFKDYLLFTDNDIYRSLYAAEILEPSISIYYRRDNLQPFYYWKRHVARLEPLIIKKNDITLCNSEELMEYPASFGVPAKMVGQGVYLEAYDPQDTYSIPTDIASIPHPRIGYVGAIISTRLDAELIYHLAQKEPSYSFILVGSADNCFLSHHIRQLPNVYFLGQKKLADVPIYLNAMDVCFNPQVINEVTNGNYPRKIDEYLAMGKPIVATSTRTMQNIFSEYVHLASNLEEYSQKLKIAIAECNNKELQKQRITFAHTHSWEHSVDNIYKAIKDFTTTQ